MKFDRRAFLKGTAAAGLLLNAHPDAVTGSARAATPTQTKWDAGGVRHILPSVSDSRMLIKASFAGPLNRAPTLQVGNKSIRGVMTDTRGEFWQFYATDLNPGRSYRLA